MIMFVIVVMVRVVVIMVVIVVMAFAAAVFAAVVTGGGSGLLLEERHISLGPGIDGGIQAVAGHRGARDGVDGTEVVGGGASLDDVERIVGVVEIELLTLELFSPRSGPRGLRRSRGSH